MLLQNINILKPLHCKGFKLFMTKFMLHLHFFDLNPVLIYYIYDSVVIFINTLNN